LEIPKFQKVFAKGETKVEVLRGLQLGNLRVQASHCPKERNLTNGDAQLLEHSQVIHPK